MRNLIVASLFVVIGSAGTAGVASSEFSYVSDLAAEGYMLFATCASGNATFGMMKDQDMYLFFIADTSEMQVQRQQVLLSEISGENPTRVVPNIPVLCILTQ